jgi:membrane associated rhomboid family serine protease
MRDYNMQMVPMSPVVKVLMIVNVAIWFCLVVIAQAFFMDHPYLFDWFGLVPVHLIYDFWVWQPLTYMFLHSANVLHVVFNMLLLWWLGSELEHYWGSRFFLLYYLVTGVGAAVLYTLGVLGYFLITGRALVLGVPVVGASGAIFGLMVAYGYYFGERVVLFMMIFPMKARYFVMLLGGIELVTLLNSGMSGDVANLAHLGGLVAGVLFLLFWNLGNRLKNRSYKRNGRKLKLVVDNERLKDSQPRYWN